MNNNKANELIENALNSLTESLENGQSDELKKYLETMSRFHSYSLRNIMLIALQKSSATHVAGFHSWKKLGRFVKKGEKAELIALHPYGRKKLKLKYFQLWSHAVLDENGKSLLQEKDGLPIAVLEFMRDLTGTDYLNSLSLKARINIIAQALVDMPHGFERVRIYQADKKGRNLSLISAKGYKNEIENATVGVELYPRLLKSIDNFMRTGDGTFCSVDVNPDPLVPNERMERFVHWPLMKGNRLVGMLSVSSDKDCISAKRCSEDSIDILAPYAEEALKCLLSRQASKSIPEVDTKLSELDSKCGLRGTPEDILRILAIETTLLTECEHVYFRYQSEGNGLLLPIYEGDYGAVALKSFNIRDRKTPSMRVIISGREEIENNTKKNSHYLEFLRSLNPNARTILEDAKSYCVQPLIFEGRCIGCMGLIAESKNHFNEQRIALARGIALRATGVLHDFLVNFERDKVKDELAKLEARKDFVLRAIHNIRNPASIIDTNVAVLKRDYSLEPEVSNIVDRIQGQNRRIQQLANRFLMYSKPLSARLTAVNLYSTINDISLMVGTHLELKIDINKSGRPRKILLDRDGFEWLIEEMLTNSAKMKATLVEIDISFSDKKVALMIEDNGKGVPSELQDSLFEPFRTGDSLATGLGLAIVKNIIEEHLGSIELYTKGTKGARFLIHLPHTNENMK